MCILFLAIDQHPEYPLIICANRDEFHARPTLAAHYWPKNPELLAGQDLEAGGSWFGINQQGHFAAVTNIRSKMKPLKNKKSRGKLVIKALTSDSAVNLDWLNLQCTKYNPFNLIYGPLDNLNCYNSVSQTQTLLTRGFHAISNGSLDDVWPKMATGERQLERLVLAGSTLNSEKLLAILTDQTQAEDSQLPNTGVPLEWERLLSSIFICSPDYGTRSSSLILQHQNGLIEFIEAQYDSKGNQTEKNSFVMSTSN